LRDAPTLREVFARVERQTKAQPQLRSAHLHTGSGQHGEPDLTPHGLRHTAASLAIAAGANVKVVQQMLGHKTASMTLDLYGHLFPDQLDDVADRLDVIGRAAAENSADFLRTRGEVRMLPDVAASG
jgi:integrase